MVVRLVIQFLESGELVFPLRDRLLENKLEDKWTVAPKARQPETWATLVTPKRPTFEAEKGEVAATVETGGRILYKTAGKLVFGCNKDDYHEYFLWLDKPYEHLSGRYGLQLLAGRAEYLKIPREKGEPPQQWWMMDKVWKTPAPYIMTHNREKEEAKARREGLKRIIWNANVIPILLADPVLKQTLEGYTKEQIDAKVKEFSKDKGEWNKK